MIIDYFRILSDPICSNWRIEKTYERLILLNKYYPLRIINTEININPIDTQEIINKCIDSIYDYIKNKDDIIIIGFYVYNYFLLKSEYKKIELINIPYLELISKNYKDDFTNIFNILKELYPQSKFDVKEYYPFYMYNGFNAEIYIDGELILILYDYDNKCIPYQKLNFIDYNSNIEYKDYKINIGTFNLTFLYAYLNIIKNKIFKFNDIQIMYEKFVSHLLIIREFYFKKNKKNILDDTIFKDFITDCIFPDFNPDHENLIRYEKRKEKNKPSMYVYDPNRNKKLTKDENFYFPNISGNQIKNNKHSKLFNNNSDENDINDINDINDENDKN
jgi:hypothetical protein